MQCNSITERQNKWKEAIYALFSISLFIYILRSPLFVGETSFGHDNYYWNYSLFHFFAESLINGNLPLWNPYTHGGEPFFPILGQMRLLDPIMILTVLIGKLFTTNIGLLFNWHRVLLSLVTFSGVYLLLRRYTSFLLVRFSLITILLFSSVMLGSFRSDGIIHDFLWAPFLLFFLMRIFIDGDTRWSHWLALAGFIGLNFQSYFFVPSTLLVLFFFVGMFLFHRVQLNAVYRCQKFTAKICALLFLLVCFSLPNLAVLLEQKYLAFPARTLPAHFEKLPPSGASYCFEGGPESMSAGIRMPLKAIAYSGTFLNLWNFLELLAPDGNKWIHSTTFKWRNWGRASEAYLYLGAIPWLLILIGIFMAKHELKKLWLTLFIGFSLFALGPPGGLQPLLYYIYPPTWFLRHGAYLSLYVELGMLFFFVVGFNHIIENVAPFKIKSLSLPALHTAGVCLILVIGFLGLLQVPHPFEYALILGILGLSYLAFIFRKELLGEGYTLSIFFAHILTLFWLHPHKEKLLVSLTLCLALPTLAYLLNRRYRNERSGLSPLLAVFFLLTLQCDLLYRMKEVDVLFNGTLSPSTAVGAERNALPPISPRERLISPPKPLYFNQDYQDIRYSEVLFRKPFVLGAVRETGNSRDIFEQALLGKRWDYYILSKHYQKLIYQFIPPVIIRELLGVDRPLFEWKAALITKSEAQWLSEFNQNAAAQSLEYLSNFAVSEVSTLLPAPATISFTGKANINIHYLHYDYNSADLVVAADRDGFFLWRDGYDRHWKAMVDGRVQPIYRANFNQKGITLAEGLHRIQFRYEPSAFIYSLIPFFTALLISFSAATTALLSPVIIRDFERENRAGGLNTDIVCNRNSL